MKAEEDSAFRTMLRERRRVREFKLYKGRGTNTYPVVFHLKNKMPDSWTTSPPAPAHTLGTDVWAQLLHLLHILQNHTPKGKGIKHKWSMYMYCLKGLIPLCSGWRGKGFEEAIAIDDFLFMVKVADSYLKIQPTLAFFSVGIDLLFF